MNSINMSMLFENVFESFFQTKKTLPESIKGFYIQWFGIFRISSENDLTLMRIENLFFNFENAGLSIRHLYCNYRNNY